MDANAQKALALRAARTVKALKENRFGAEVVTADALIARIRELVPEGASCSVGGAMTLNETGVQEHLRCGRYKLYDRYAEGVDPGEIFHQALGCDWYFMSSNAITEDGRLYNIDGRGNRLAALAYGPERVMVIAGFNKIVPDLDAARARMKSAAAPANAIRLNCATPCAATGRCEDCSSPGRICCTEMVTHRCMVEGRVHVLLVEGSYGY